VLGTQIAGKLDGAETITVDGIDTDDGTYVRWIGTNVDGRAGGGITVAIVLGIVFGENQITVTDDGISVTGIGTSVDGTDVGTGGGVNGTVGGASTI